MLLSCQNAAADSSCCGKGNRNYATTKGIMYLNGEQN